MKQQKYNLTNCSLNDRTHSFAEGWKNMGKKQNSLEKSTFGKKYSKFCSETHLILHG